MTRTATTAVPLHPVLATRWSTRAYDPTARLTDGELTALLEAARWAPSRSNGQPARFLVGRRGDATYTGLYAALKPGNQLWAGGAAALVAGVAPRRDADGPSHGAYDLGQAVAHLSVQATALGLSVRQMAGFSAEAVAAAFGLPDDHEALVVVAVGRRGDEDALADELRAKEAAPRARRPLAESTFAGEWGRPLALDLPPDAAAVDADLKSVPLTAALHAYVLAHSEPLDAVQRALVDETRALGAAARLQVAPEQAPLLTLLVRLTGARRVVEVGTFTGLSALALAKGLPEGGSLTCFDVDESWTAIARRAWQRAGVADRIALRLGDARQTLRTLQDEAPVDLAFVDADKDGYAAYLDLLLPVVRPGGLLVFDNTLSRGGVLFEGADGNAGAIRAFNARLAADDRLEQVLLPVADGLTLARKRE